MPFVYDDIYEICKERRFLIDWLQGRGLLGDFSGICECCFEGKVKLVEDKYYSKDGVVWRCTNRKCNKKVSIREGSWFSGSHLLEQIVKLTYYWVYSLPNDHISRELKIGSEHTLVDWKNFAREVCLEILQQDNCKIGGVGKVVEIDESKFGKRKYHRGKRVDVALPIEDREWNLTKSILARVCTLNVCGYSTLLRSVQWKVHKNTLLKQYIFLLWGGTNLHECLEWTEICQ